MLEVIELNDSKNVMKNLNVIIYGTVRDIEHHFIKSFSNIDLLCNFFNNVLIIIFENDSFDNTRNLLNNWASFSNPKVKKHLILENNLNQFYPLRAHRLAYCRNKIINFIFNNNLDNYYQYAIHCDLDDRFWSLDYDSICNCFQYDLNSWDAMFGTNKDYYYDFWALRCDETWFNKNIFSCEVDTDGTYKNYEKYIPDFINFIKNNKNNLIPVNSAFNGIGIYKLSSIKNCRYNADYICNKCNGNKIGCLEDNDHIGLHKNMKQNNCKLFINKNMIIDCKKDEYISYSDFIKNMINNKIINKDPLKYVLYKKIVDKKDIWINFSEKLGNFENVISNFTDNNIYSFCINNNFSFSNNFINNNVIKYVDNNLSKSINNFILNNINSYISFIHIDFDNYYYTRNILEKLHKKINNNCIIVFNKFINFNEYLTNNLHAFYEFTQKYNISFDSIGSKNKFIVNPNNEKNYEFAIKITNNPYLSYTTITNELFIYEDIFINFDWKKYIELNNDISHIKSKLRAWEHWFYYGKNEGREYYSFDSAKEVNKNVNNNNNNNNKLIPNEFDWKSYIKNNKDLYHINSKEEAWDHWSNYGMNEGRTYYTISTEIDKKVIPNDFDWKSYIKNNKDLYHINSKEEAWDHWNNYGKNEGRFFFDKKCLKITNFDWKYYIKNNKDLYHMKSKEEAWDHWNNYGKNENRLFKKKNKKNNSLFNLNI
jgi:hypothetical protein